MWAGTSVGSFTHKLKNDGSFPVQRGERKTKEERKSRKEESQTEISKGLRVMKCERTRRTGR